MGQVREEQGGEDEDEGEGEGQHQGQDELGTRAQAFAVRDDWQMDRER